MAKVKNNATGNTACTLSEADRDRLELDRQSYDKLAAEQSLSLDKHIITISGASFSVAIAFIDKIIRMDKSVWLWSFWAAMLFLVIAIVVTTLSFWCSESAIRYARKCVDDCEKTGDINELYKQNNWTRTLVVINWLRLAAFILGMLFLGVFIFYNGIRQSYFDVNPKKQEISMSDKDTTQTVRVPCKDSGRFGLEPPQPRPQTSSQQQPQQQPQPQQPAASEKK